jgi:peptide/nickel transport system permease protein/oligopeptide transport system permease protein
MVTIFFVAIVIFLMVRLLPGDPARVIAGLFASEQDVERIRVQLGLDQPLWTQAWIFIKDLARGDLGISARTLNPVSEEILTRLPATLRLAAAALLLAIGAGIPLGAWAAARAGSAVDLLISTFVLFGISMPVYWLGLMLIIVFSIRLRWLPAAGADGWLALILPAVTLAAFSIAFIVRITRGSLLEVLRQDYVRTARSKGLAERMVIVRHTLKNAMIPVITLFAVQFAFLMGGTVVLESIYSLPGLGQLTLQAVKIKDYSEVQGLVLFFATVLVLINLAVDLSYAWFDPRIRYN